MFAQVLEASRVVGMGESVYPDRTEWVEADKVWLSKCEGFFWHTMEAEYGKRS